jgi:hypothetical protein
MLRCIKVTFYLYDKKLYSSLLLFFSIAPFYIGRVGSVKSVSEGHPCNFSSDFFFAVKSIGFSVFSRLLTVFSFLENLTYNFPFFSLKQANYPSKIKSNKRIKYRRLGLLVMFGSAVYLTIILLAIFFLRVPIEIHDYDGFLGDAFLLGLGFFASGLLLTVLSD